MVLAEVLEVGATLIGQLGAPTRAGDAGAANRFRNRRFAFAVTRQEDRDRGEAVDRIFDGGEPEPVRGPRAVPFAFLRGEFGDLLVGERVPNRGLGGGFAGQPVDEDVKLPPRQTRRTTARPMQVPQVVLREVVVDVAFERLRMLGDEMF